MLRLYWEQIILCVLYLKWVILQDLVLVLLQFFMLFVFFFSGKKDGFTIKTLSATYGVFGILGIMHYIMIMVLGNRTEGGNPNDSLFYSLFTMDALAVTCIVPAILGVILLILVWRRGLPIVE